MSNKNNMTDSQPDSHYTMRQIALVYSIALQK